VEQESDEGVAEVLQENAVTMGKMLDLRRRMETLSVRRRCHRTGQAHPPLQYHFLSYQI
jgi:hypothetical protein